MDHVDDDGFISVKEEEKEGEKGFNEASINESASAPTFSTVFLSLETKFALFFTVSRLLQIFTVSIPSPRNNSNANIDKSDAGDGGANLSPFGNSVEHHLFWTNYYMDQASFRDSLLSNLTRALDIEGISNAPVDSTNLSLSFLELEVRERLLHLVMQASLLTKTNDDRTSTYLIYDARARRVLIALGHQLEITGDRWYELTESSLIHELGSGTLSMSTNPTESEAENRKRWFYTGLAATGGALAVGLTAGLAAPIVIPALMGLIGATASATGLVGASAAFATLFGVAGAGVAGYKVNKRLSGLNEFEMIKLSLVAEDNSPSLASSTSSLASSQSKTPSSSSFGSSLSKAFSKMSKHISRSFKSSASSLKVEQMPTNTNQVMLTTPPSFTETPLTEPGSEIIADIGTPSLGIVSSVLPTNPPLRVAICVSGWVSQGAQDHFTPWSRLKDLNPHTKYTELYVLKWETEVLLALGNSIQNIIKSGLLSLATNQLLLRTSLAALTSAMMFPVGLLQAGDLIDNPWSMGVDRAKKAGKELARLLRTEDRLKMFGGRPVDLYGFGLGALVIYTCLRELAIIQENGEEESKATLASGHGIVGNVCLMGLPVAPIQLSIFTQLRTLVSGRFLHCYSTNDWVLRLVYRTAGHILAKDIAGLVPIENVPEIENIDLGAIVKGHLEYAEFPIQLMLDLLYDFR